MENFDFGKYWKKAQQEASIEAADEANLHGTIQIKDVDGIAQTFMGEWHRADRTGDKYKRFVTQSEFARIFDENLGIQLERDLERAGIARDDRIRRNAEKWSTPKTTIKNSWERLDHTYETRANESILKWFDGNKEAKEALQRFYRLYPVYELFGITNEYDRRAIAERLQEDDDGYFWAMRASNPALSDFFLIRRRFRIPETAREKHSYIVAGTGAGKSELLKSFIWQHVVHGETGVIILDPNGDFAEQVAKFKEFANPKFKERLVYFDPNLSSTHTPVINPFELPADSSEDVLDTAAQQMFKSLNHSFTELDTAPTAQMQTMLLNMIPVILRKPNGSLRDLFRFLDFKENSDLIELGKTINNPEIRRFFENKFNQRDLAPSIPGMETRLYRMATSGMFMRLICGKSTINLKQAMEEKKVVIFNLSKGKLGDDLSRIFGRFVLTSIYNLIFARADVPERQRVPCHIYIDEFHNYITSTIKEAFVEGRKYKGYLTVVTQMVGQEMSTDFKDLILGNANVKIIGKSGHKSRKEMIQEMDVDDVTERVTGISKKSFRNLKTGEFIVQIDTSQPFKMTNRTKLLQNKHAMTTQQWDEIRQEQIQKYYTSKITAEQPEVSPPLPPQPPTPSNEQPKDVNRAQDEKRPFGKKYDF